MPIQRPLRHGSLAALLLATTVYAGAGQAQEAAAPPTLESLQERIATLENLAVRTQSHVMMDVEFHFANLWYAAHSEQWDLAAFYLRETKSHLAWTVRMRPVRNVAGGGTVQLKPFQDAIEQGGFTPLAATVDKHDLAAFETTYKQTLAQCHACHQASGLGYLDPHVPTSPNPPSPLMIMPH